MRTASGASGPQPPLIEKSRATACPAIQAPAVKLVKAPLKPPFHKLFGMDQCSLVRVRYVKPDLVCVFTANFALLGKRHVSSILIAASAT